MRVLIADDDIVSRRVLEKRLTTAGYEVEVACDGEQALARLRAPNPPKLALLDWMMPKMDGPALFRQMKLRPETSSLPVVFITAKASQHDLDELLRLGAAGAISKPFSPKDLPDQLRAIWAKLP